MTVAVIGGGFAGLVTAARVREARVDDVRIVEKGRAVRAAWGQERYPRAPRETGSPVSMSPPAETWHRSS